VSEREIAVAAAVIEHPDGRFLLAQRPQGKVYAGYWEFPGGKVEPGESVEGALKRELREELGIGVVATYPWITRIHKYPHGTVRLHFLRVVEWTGEPHPHEGQTLAWQVHGALDVSPMLPANAPILKALSLPLTCGITHAWEVGTEQALAELQTAIDGGLKLIQIRESALPPTQRASFAAAVVAKVRAAGGIALVNGDHGLAREIGADGVHLPARQLMATSRRPQAEWCGASCHDESEIRRAVELELDYVLLGPLRATPTHPGKPGIGWERFAELARGCPVPILALGGLNPRDLDMARSRGAHGIAMVRGAWQGHCSSG
jgi:8-oxo-dGTP diphosphatase